MSPVWVLLLFHFGVVNPSRCSLCLLPHSFISFDCCLFFSICVFISLCVASVALALVFMPELYPTAYRATFPAFFYAVASSLFLLFVFVYVFYFIATMSFAGYFLVRSLMSAFHAYLRFPVWFVVWFRLSCDHGWICSGSVVNVRKRKEKKNCIILPSNHTKIGAWVNNI